MMNSSSSNKEEQDLSLFSVVHDCALKEGYRIEKVGNCHKPNHVYCFVCKSCSNEFHVIRQKYVESFTHDSYDF